MTRSDFIELSKSFDLGRLYVVSGPDLDETLLMLEDSRAAIESATSKQVLVFDSRSKVTYSERDFRRNVNEARLWEFVAVLAENDFVVLIANEFDRDDPAQNPRPQTLVIDVMMDLIQPANILPELPNGMGKLYAGFRELAPFMKQVYFFDGSDEVMLIKDQTPDRT